MYDLPPAIYAKLLGHVSRSGAASLWQSFPDVPLGSLQPGPEDFFDASYWVSSFNGEGLGILLLEGGEGR